MRIRVGGACLVKVQRFAKSRDLSINPPNIAGDKMPDGLSSKKLGRSGGVIEPRPMNDPAVLHPKSDRDYRMPTTPDIAPETHMNQNSGARAVHPSDRALLESILVAARNAARRGYEQACLERLKTAQRLAEHQDR